MSDPRPRGGVRDAAGTPATTTRSGTRWPRAAIDPHGEVAFLMHLRARPRCSTPGCGTGRVAIELARRGVDAVGRRPRRPAARPRHGRRRRDAPVAPRATSRPSTSVGTFDVVVLAGNVMIFVAPGTEAAVLANLRPPPRARRSARRRVPGAARVVCPSPTFDADADGAGLTRASSGSPTWVADPFTGGDYAVSVLVAHLP